MSTGQLLHGVHVSYVSMIPEEYKLWYGTAELFVTFPSLNSPSNHPIIFLKQISFLLYLLTRCRNCFYNLFATIISIIHIKFILSFRFRLHT